MHPGRESGQISLEMLANLLAPGTRQHEAALLALTTRVAVIAGGPGTGKTHTIAALLAALAAGDEFPTVAVAAPTGKAAARLGEALDAMAHEVADEAASPRAWQPWCQAPSTVSSAGPGTGPASPTTSEIVSLTTW